jgi:hypothetical protein
MGRDGHREKHIHFTPNDSIMNERCWLPVVFVCLACAALNGQTLEPRPLFVEAYTNQLSYVPGEEVALHVSTSASQYSLEVARLGAKREVTLAKMGIVGHEHNVPENASSHGCNWPESMRFTIPADWRSGYYSVVVSVEDRGGAFVQRGRRTASGEAFFVVRAKQPGQSSPVLIQLATNTYNAYNNWGGHSLYAYHARAKLQGHRVSFDRPPSSQFSSWELPFVAWAETEGIALEYAVNSDLEFHPEMLSAYKLVLSVATTNTGPR